MSGTYEKCYCGGIGRHAGLKILWAAMLVPVRSRPGTQFSPEVKRLRCHPVTVYGAGSTPVRTAMSKRYSEFLIQNLNNELGYWTGHP